MVTRMFPKDGLELDYNDWWRYSRNTEIQLGRFDGDIGKKGKGSK